MSSNNTTTPTTTNNTTSNNNNNNGNGNDSNVRSNGMGAATYYGAAIVAIFLLIALSIVFRIIYTRKTRRRNGNSNAIDSNARDQEERLAMERRGEEAGLPTYRESILRPNGDTILASTPMSNHPFPRTNTQDTLPNQDLTEPILNTTTVVEGAEPPKYEEDRSNSSDRNHLQVQPLDHHPSNASNTEMRMSSTSNTTLVLPSINPQPDQAQHSSESNDSEQPSPKPRSSSSSRRNSTTRPSITNS